MKKIIYFFIFILISCSDDDEIAVEEPEILNLTLRSPYANEENSYVVTEGIFAIWWDKKFIEVST